MRLEQRGSVFVALSSFVEKDIAKGAGFRWHDVGGSYHRSGCKACSEGVESRVWWTDSPENAAKLASFAEGDLRDHLIGFGARQDALKAASKAATTDADFPRPDGLTYMPFQRAGIAFVLAAREHGAKGALIGDEMGLGKTIQAIGVVNALGLEKVLIVCPASLKLNWARELRKWLVKPLTIGIAEGKSWPDAQVVLVNFDILTKHADRLAEEWPLVVVDECHLCKNGKAKRTQALYGSRDGGDGVNAEFIVAMSGTPIVNRPNELWTLMQAIDPAGLGKSWFVYHTRYCGARRDRFGWNIGGATNLGELHEKLRRGIMVRRLKADVLTELPAKRRGVVLLPEDGMEEFILAEGAGWARCQERVEAAQAEVELAAAESEAAYAAAVERLQAEMRLAFTEIAAMRHDLAVAKLPAALEYLEGCEGEKVVVFAHHHDVIDRLCSELGDAAVKLDGRMTLADRQAAVDRFQTDPTCTAFIGSIKAAGVGITLTAASHVVFAELDWVPGNITQAEDRCHRIGQVWPVNVEHLVVDGSLDARMAQTLVEKQDVIDRALDRELDPRELAAPVLPLAEKRDVRRKEIEVDAESMTPERVEAVHNCLRALAGLDGDFALVRNNMGFSKIDVRVGHSLAEAARLTPKQAALGARLVNKYRRQLPHDMVALATGKAE